ncbi:MAG: DUF167 domain-containing protein [Desulfobacteraceae bacterium]|jgi:uncharacterized protein (TIGR00251 family)
MIAIKETTNGLTFSVYVQPRSSRLDIVGSHQQALKIKLTAPPVGGAANRQCIQVLAKTLQLPKSTLTITCGQTNRRKHIRIEPGCGSFTPQELARLKNALLRLSSKSS